MVDLSGAARESALLTSSQVLLAPGPHFDNYRMRSFSLVIMTTCKLDSIAIATLLLRKRKLQE